MLSVVLLLSPPPCTDAKCICGAPNKPKGTIDVINWPPKLPAAIALNVWMFVESRPFPRHKNSECDTDAVLLSNKEMNALATQQICQKLEA